MTLTTDDRNLITAVRALAKMHPERVYNKGNSDECHYRPDALNPDGCIIGAGVRIGLGITTLDQEDYDQAIACNALVRVGKFSEDVLDWAALVQMNQDDGTTWGEAVRRADERFELDTGSTMS